MLLVDMKLKHGSEQHSLGQIKDFDFELELIGRVLSRRSHWRVLSRRSHWRVLSRRILGPDLWVQTAHAGW